MIDVLSGLPELPRGYVLHEGNLHQASGVGALDAGARVCTGWFTITEAYRAMGDEGISYVVEGAGGWKDSTPFVCIVPARTFVAASKVRQVLARREVLVLGDHKGAFRKYVRAVQQFAMGLPHLNWHGLSPSLPRVAHHEAAHAIMAWHHGGGVERLLARGTYGVAWTYGVSGEAEAQVFLAGLAANEEWMRRRGFDAPDAWRLHRHLPPGADYHEALRILGTHEAVERCYYTVRQFIHEHWGAVSAAAEWLTSHRTLKHNGLAKLQALVARYLRGTVQNN